MQCDVREPAEKACKRKCFKNTELSQLRNMSPEEIDAWVSSNINSVPDARSMIATLTKAVVQLVNDNDR